MSLAQNASMYRSQCQLGIAVVIVIHLVSSLKFLNELLW